MQTGDCQFVFISHPTSKRIKDIFRERLDRAFGSFGIEASEHCVILERLNPDKFVAAIGQCDVVLDTPEWSGGNSTLESLTHDLPIVTLPGSLMRGRHTAAILQLMSIEETIAGSLDDYVAIAVRLANDPVERLAIKSRIAENKNRLFGDHTCILALEDFLDRVVRERRGSVSAS
jgi:protein O-GlcNAc transferase